MKPKTVLKFFKPYQQLLLQQDMPRNIKDGRKHAIQVPV